MYLCDELFLKHFSLQIKQNVYSIGTYSAPEATQILVKMYRKIAKSHIVESVLFFYSSTFSGYKDVCFVGNGRRVYQPKDRLASSIKLRNWQVMMVNKDINFLSIFCQYFA